MSALEFAGLSVPAFSGRGSNVNKRAMACAIEKASDFSLILAMLRSIRPRAVTGAVGAYGVLTVS